MNILISGGTGSIGAAISEQLIDKGYQLRYLSRKPAANKLNIPEYFWDPDKGKIDEASLENADAIINLSGAPINKRWTPAYKNEILRSRVDGTRLLFEKAHNLSLKLKTFISASAVGYYPNDLHREFTEEDTPGTDFLSLICQNWEQQALNFENLGIRTVCLRIGIVLSKKGGALQPIAQTAKLGLGAALGNGKQWMPWIHINDLANMFVYALENEKLNGIYNAVGPYNVTNKDLTGLTAKTLRKPFFMPNIPAFVLKAVMGEMASIALASNKVSAKKIQESGFHYQFSKLEDALNNLLI